MSANVAQGAALEFIKTGNGVLKPTAWKAQLGNMTMQIAAG
jgi:hypothetical protein